MATHYDFLNDRTECRTILSLLLPKLTAELRDIVPKLVREKLFDPAIMTDYGDEIYKLEAENMLQAMTVAANRTAPYFITSFCIHDPSEPAYVHGLLSQWRGYARGGFAIEFDELLVDKLCAEEREKYKYQGILTEKVLYRDHEERLKDDEFSGFAGTLLKNLFPNKADSIAKILGTKTTNDFARPFLEAAPFLKHASFEEENEYRIVALCNRPRVSDPNDKRTAKPIKFRPRANGEIVPFISLYEDLGKLLPIKAIVVGPHPQQESRRVALEILLEKCGLANVPVRFSDIPFRE